MIQKSLKDWFHSSKILVQLSVHLLIEKLTVIFLRMIKGIDYWFNFGLTFGSSLKCQKNSWNYFDSKIFKGLISFFKHFGSTLVQLSVHLLIEKLTVIYLKMIKGIDYWFNFGLTFNSPFNRKSLQLSILEWLKG